MKTTLHRLNELIRQYNYCYLPAFLLILGIKYFYSKAGCDKLIWILAPTSKWVSILSGISFTYEPGMGYVNHDLRYVIAPSCSGVQFMIIIMATLIFSFVHRTGKKCFGWTLGSILLSYPLTVFVNGLRIMVAIYLPLYLEQRNFLSDFLSPGRLHTLIGTIIYFVSLLTIHHLADFISLRVTTTAVTGHTSIIRKFLPPVFWYFFIVLGIPLLNRAGQSTPEQFAEYTLLIVSACGLILGVAVSASLLQKYAKPGNQSS